MLSREEVNAAEGYFWARFAVEMRTAVSRTEAGGVSGSSLVLGKLSALVREALSQSLILRCEEEADRDLRRIRIGEEPAAAAPYGPENEAIILAAVEHWMRRVPLSKTAWRPLSVGPAQESAIRSQCQIISSFLVQELRREFVRRRAEHDVSRAEAIAARPGPPLPVRSHCGETPQAVEAPTLKPCERMALYAYELAELKWSGPERMKMADAWHWLREYGPTEYVLPAQATFARYVREARKAHGGQKNHPRAGRTGRSIVSVRDR